MASLQQQQPDERRTKDFRRLLRFFRLRAAKHGNLLGQREIAEYVRKNKLSVSASQIENIRQHFKPTAVRRNAPARPARFSGIAVPSLGVVQVDLAFFDTRWKNKNNWNVGVLVACAPATNLAYVHPIKNKSEGSIEAAIEALLDSQTFPSVHTIYSDMETAIRSRHFIEKINRQYGIRIVFLRRGVQCFSVERLIRTLKTKTFTVMELRGSKFRWMDALRDVVSSHNSEKCFGTAYRRKDVTESNFLDYMNQRYKCEDATLYFNASSIATLDSAWSRKLFKFQKGERVVVTRRADITKKKLSLSYKPSVDGTYSDTVFVVKSGALMLPPASRGRTHAVETYRIAPLSDQNKLVKARFYPEELRRADFAQDGDGDDDADGDDGDVSPPQ